MSWLFAITVISGPIPHEDSIIILTVYLLTKEYIYPLLTVRQLQFGGKLIKSIEKDCLCCNQRHLIKSLSKKVTFFFVYEYN